MTDAQLRAWWRGRGGSFHGPRVETATMPEAQLLPALRSLMEEKERWEHNAQVYKNALWKACGDDESSVQATIDSQGELR